MAGAIPLGKGDRAETTTTTPYSGYRLGVAFGYGFGCIFVPGFRFFGDDLRVPFPPGATHHYGASHLGVRIGPG